jgi:hypothetical protein
LQTHSANKFACEFCKKEFSRESTLLTHTCEKKRRWKQEHEPGVRLGFNAFNRFYELTQQLNKKQKTYAEFVESSFYIAFVKFGRYIVGINAVNPLAFIDWVIKENKKLDTWTTEKVYSEYLVQYIKHETVESALERSIIHLEEYTKTIPDLKNGISDIYRYGNQNKIVNMIVNGRISPWSLYNSESGIKFLDSLNIEQVEMVLPFIDPEFWGARFEKSKEDVQWAKKLLTDLGM